MSRTTASVCRDVEPVLWQEICAVSWQLTRVPGEDLIMSADLIFPCLTWSSWRGADDVVA